MKSMGQKIAPLNTLLLIVGNSSGYALSHWDTCDTWDTRKYLDWLGVGGS